MVVIAQPPKTVWVYRFDMYDVQNDGMHRSARWGTKEAIEKIGGFVAGSPREVLEAYVQPPHTDVDGLTQRGFNPDAQEGFQRSVL